MQISDGSAPCSEAAPLGLLAEAEPAAAQGWDGGDGGDRGGPPATARCGQASRQLGPATVLLVTF